MLYSFGMDTLSLLKAAIEHAGSQTTLAERAGCSQVAIHKALKAGRVSPLMAIRLEKATEVPRHLWRPDLWPAPIAKPQPERLAG